MDTQYVVRFDDGSHMVTSSFLEWCMFSPSCSNSKIEKFENKMLKWMFILFTIFILVFLLFVYVSCGSL